MYSRWQNCSLTIYWQMQNICFYKVGVKVKSVGPNTFAAKTNAYNELLDQRSIEHIISSCAEECTIFANLIDEIVQVLFDIRFPRSSHWHGLALVPTWISNHVNSKLWFIPKFQRLHRWSFGMDKLLHSIFMKDATEDNVCNKRSGAYGESYVTVPDIYF